MNAVHVSSINLERASDRTIWSYALKHDFDLVSKDADFSYLASLSEARPRLIWVRLGNCRTEALCEAFEKIWPQLSAWMESSEKIIEIR